MKKFITKSILLIGVTFFTSVISAQTATDEVILSITKKRTEKTAPVIDQVLKSKAGIEWIAYCEQHAFYTLKVSAGKDSAVDEIITELSNNAIPAQRAVLTTAQYKELCN